MCIFTSLGSETKSVGATEDPAGGHSGEDIPRDQVVVKGAQPSAVMGVDYFYLGIYFSKSVVGDAEEAAVGSDRLEHSLLPGRCCTPRVGPGVLG